MNNRIIGILGLLVVLIVVLFFGGCCNSAENNIKPARFYCIEGNTKNYVYLLDNNTGQIKLVLSPRTVVYDTFFDTTHPYTVILKDSKNNEITRSSITGLWKPGDIFYQSIHCNLKRGGVNNE